MSRSAKNKIQNPAKRFFQWSGDEAKLKYFDKTLGEKGENVFVDLPFGFMVLDVLVTMTGFYEKENSGFWSNEIKQNRLKVDKLTVKTKSGIHAEDVYANLGDVKAKGAKYTQSVYIAYPEGEGDERRLVMGNIKFVGSSLSAWIDYTKNIPDIEAGRFAIVDKLQKKKGKSVYYEPVFKHTTKISDEDEAAATELDRQLQAYLKSYFEAQGSSNGSGNQSPDAMTHTGDADEEEDYRTTRDRLLEEGERHPNAPKDEPFTGNPVAKNAADLASTKQFNMIRALCKKLELDINAECFDLFQCKVDQLSKFAASAFITHLQDMEKEQATEDAFDNMSPKKKAVGASPEFDDSDIPPFG